jgi:hypothetical protein
VAGKTEDHPTCHKPASSAAGLHADPRGTCLRPAYQVGPKGFCNSPRVELFVFHWSCPPFRQEDGASAPIMLNARMPRHRWGTSDL